MRWALFFLVLAAGGLWLLIAVRNRASLPDELEALSDDDLALADVFGSNDRDRHDLPKGPR